MLSGPAKRPDRFVDCENTRLQREEETGGGGLKGASGLRTWVIWLGPRTGMTHEPERALPHGRHHGHTTDLTHARETTTPGELWRKP